MQEVYEICQTVTVLRDARHIVTAPVADLPKDRLIEAMTGENVHLGVADAASRVRDENAPVALTVEKLAGDDFADISFTIRRGEVVGLSGSTSSGRVGVAEAIAGLGALQRRRPHRRQAAALRRCACGTGARGRLRYEEPTQGGPRTLHADRRQHDDDRELRLAVRLSCRPSALDLAHEAIRSLGVVTQGPDQLVSGLSGGNQQKVVMGRALANAPSVLVLMDPTAGVDVKSKEALLGVVERMRQEGKAILVVSSEVDRSSNLRPGAGDAPRIDRRGTQGGLDGQRARRLHRRN